MTLERNPERVWANAASQLGEGGGEGGPIAGAFLTQLFRHLANHVTEARPRCTVSTETHKSRWGVSTSPVGSPPGEHAKYLITASGGASLTGGETGPRASPWGAFVLPVVWTAVSRRTNRQGGSKLVQATFWLRFTRLKHLISFPPASPGQRGGRVATTSAPLRQIKSPLQKRQLQVRATCLLSTSSQVTRGRRVQPH